MLNLRFTQVTVGLASWVFLAGVLAAADGQLQKGIVVSAGSGRLSIKDSLGKEQSFSVDATAKVTVNGKPGRLDDLQEGVRVQVMTDEKGKVTMVSTIDKDKRAKTRVLVVSGTARASDAQVARQR